MGSTVSKSVSGSVDEKVFHIETPISFSQDVVNRLADNLEGSETTPERQSVLDSHIRSRIKDELEHLRKGELEVRQEIERALEKENLDKERAMAGEASESVGAGVVRSSSALLGDLEDLKGKLEKYQARKTSGIPEVEVYGRAVTECYLRNAKTPLQCWAEVQQFRMAVDTLEKERFHSL